MKSTSIHISKNTKQKLNKIKSPGQSYDGIIREIIKTGDSNE